MGSSVLVLPVRRAVLTSQSLRELLRLPLACEPKLPTPDRTVDWIAELADPRETATSQDRGRRALLRKRVGNDGAYACDARPSMEK